jgi:hypothetical protein
MFTDYWSQPTLSAEAKIIGIGEYEVTYVNSTGIGLNKPLNSIIANGTGVMVTNRRALINETLSHEEEKRKMEAMQKIVEKSSWKKTPEIKNI